VLGQISTPELRPETAKISPRKTSDHARVKSPFAHKALDLIRHRNATSTPNAQVPSMLLQAPHALPIQAQLHLNAFARSVSHERRNQTRLPPAAVCCSIAS
jgi:hypothetical protein